MSAADDLVICNQAKALEGMRQRLKSHMRKLTERQHRVKQLETMVTLRDEGLAIKGKQLRHVQDELKKALVDRPEGYDSKCQELAEANASIEKLKRMLRVVGIEVTIV